jgi:glycosyltransferase involved in cell wall biosynthesis
VRGLYFIVPEGVDDPVRPSGGNAYDRRVSRGLAAAGWTVHMHEVAGSWPDPDAGALDALAVAVCAIPDGALVLLDGLVASPSAELLTPQAERLRLVALVHMPLDREPEGELLSAAAAVVTTSASTRRALLDLYSLPGGRVHVAEPGVDRAGLARGTATAGALLSVAAVIPGKGHDLLVDALAPLTSFRWQCLCVGSLEREPAFVARVRRRAADGGIGGRLDFPGPQAGTDLARSYATADLLVLPSRAETYGMVVVEALAHGLPVVAAEVGGVPEALGHGADGTRPGLLVPPNDPSALGDALRAWFEDAGLRRRLRRAARERRESLADWSTTASVVADVLERAA